jgi:2-oxoglutarate ferredoxin oxidoreductase subunit beta
MTYNHALPRPVGIFLSIDRPTYESQMTRQIQMAIEKRGKGDLEKLFGSGDTWNIR